VRRFAVCVDLRTDSAEHEQYVLSGMVKVALGDKTIEAKAGDVLLIPVCVAHSYETIGDEAYSFLCLVPKAKERIEILVCQIDGITR
jgi:quercetin dioxygenase-like cupin family protein